MGEVLISQSVDSNFILLGSLVLWSLIQSELFVSMASSRVATEASLGSVRSDCVHCGSVNRACSVAVRKSLTVQYGGSAGEGASLILCSSFISRLHSVRL